MTNDLSEIINFCFFIFFFLPLSLIFILVTVWKELRKHSKFSMPAVILANGEFPRSQRCLDALSNASALVCCDGAAVALETKGIRRPDAIVGDLDSLPDTLKKKYADRLRPIAEQESNDLAKAFGYCVGKLFCKEIIILGAGGKREDHLLGNIAHLADFVKQCDKVELWTDYGRFLALRHSDNLTTAPGSQISLFTLNARQTVSTQGLKWELQDRVLPRWWSGTLNEAVGAQVSIAFDGEDPVLVYLPWPEAAQKESVISTDPPRLPWRHVHFCGAGGVGVSGLAHLMLDAGVTVSGSDAVDSAYFHALYRRGAKVNLEESAGNVSPDTDLLVYSAAVPADHPERKRAAKLGIPQCKRGEFLARLAPYFQKVVAVSGSHGKTSTTAMLAHIFKENGLQPGYLIGGSIDGWQQNASWGNGRILVTEVDESDRSQELMLPTTAVILNIDDDHSWAIGGTEGLEDCFRRLARQSHRVITWDTANLRRVLGDLPNCTFLDSAKCAPQMPSLLGEHSRRNAFIACAVATLPEFGLSAENVWNALQSFPGVQRRLTLLAQEGEKFLYEDYAHHPTELAACLQALKERHPDTPMTVFFQPHRPERILRYGDRFAEILAANCESVVVLAPFMAWETQAPEANPATLVNRINVLHPLFCATLHQGKPEDLLPKLQKSWNSETGKMLYILIGAGDIGKLATLARNKLKP